MAQAYFAALGNMAYHIGSGTWGVVYQDGLVTRQRHWVKYMNRPQKLELYGDKDVFHEQIWVEDEWNEASLPANTHVDFQLSEGEYWWHGATGTHYWYGNDGLFLDYLLDDGTTPTGTGGFFPAGLVRTVFEAYECISNESGLWFRTLQPDYSRMPKIPFDDGNVVYMCIEGSTLLNRDYYDVISSSLLYNKLTHQWQYDGWSYVKDALREAAIPLFWREWMWNNHPPIPQTDYTALSELYRNTLDEATQPGINNITNIPELVGMAKDIYTGHVEKLFQSFADFFKPHTYGVSEFLFAHHWQDYLSVGQDAWLMYRYFYSTTKMDAEAAVDALLNDKLRTITDSDVFRGRIGISDGSISMKLRCHESMDLSVRLHNDFRQAGLWPDAYTIWDAIPGSFIVDWIVPDFSNNLEDLSQKYLTDMYVIDELELAYTHEWEFDWDGFTYHCKSFSRTFEFEPPQFEFYEETKHASRTTVTARAIDAAAIFLRPGGY